MPGLTSLLYLPYAQKLTQQISSFAKEAFKSWKTSSKLCYGIFT